MTPEILAEKIGLSPAATEVVLEFTIHEDESASLRELFLDPDRYDDFEKIIKEKDDPNRYALGLIFHWAVQSIDLWHKSGVPEEVAIGTLRDITIWSDRCFERYGKVGLIEWRWFIIHITVRLFRLGRLQFEPIENREDITLPDGTFIPEGKAVLSVHIPRGDGFTREAIDESFAAANPFFEKYFGKTYEEYVCESWMLAPQLDAMISETSTLAYFKTYFTIYGEHLGYSQAEEYVFLERIDDKTKYPENTSLQRNFKKFLLDGGEMGMGKAAGKF
jgi:hypothetical protein